MSEIEERSDFGSISSPEVRQAPVPFYERLRRDAPVYFDPVAKCYVVSRYKDIIFVGERPDLFSNSNDIMVGRRRSPVAEEVRRRFQERGFPELHTLVTADPPYHTRNRSVVENIFTPKFAKNFEPRVAEIANSLIDSFARRGDCDLHREFAIFLPMFIILDLLGLPRDDWERVKRWSDVALLRADPALDPESELQLADEFIEMQNYLHGHLERFRGAPAETLLSRIANAKDVTGERLSDAEAVSVSFQLMVAGNETTTTVLMSLLNRLLNEPELLARVQADRSLIPGAIEETLRLDTPIPVFYRTALKDVELGGVLIPLGSLVAISYISGNHDAEKWPGAEKLDPQRASIGQHLGFGRGPHYCIGHFLAKAELRIALNLLLDRLPNLRFTQGRPRPAFISHPFAYALDQMHLEFDVVQ